MPNFKPVSCCTVGLRCADPTYITTLLIQQNRKNSVGRDLLCSPQITRNFIIFILVKQVERINYGKSKR